MARNPREESDANRSTLLQSGWRQCSILTADLVAKVSWIPGAEKPDPARGWVLVATQDCDLVSGDLASDPAVEVVFAEQISSMDTRKQNLRHPRELHVEIQLANKERVPVSIAVRNRGFLDRQELLHTSTGDQPALSGVGASLLKGLLSGRYDRDAFPEAFDRRFRPAKAKIIALLEREKATLLDVLFKIIPNSELPDDQRYKVIVFGVLQDAFDDMPRGQTRDRRKALQADLRQAMSRCQDVDVELVEIQGRYDLSVRERADLVGLDLA